MSKSAVVNALSFDVEDWFQVENLKSVVRYEDWDKYELRVEKNTQKILEILRQHNTKATFFVLGWIAERCPNLIKHIDEEGHEIASHGYSHKLLYLMTQSEFKGDVLRSKAILEDITGKEIIGYRAPSFTIVKDTLWAIDILKECGFKYDSSIFPISFHDRYGFNGMKSIPFYFTNGLLEVPLSTVKIFKVNMPLGGGAYLRVLPYSYFHFFFKYFNSRNRGIVFYLHPWELDYKQPKLYPPLLLRLRHYVNLDKTEKKLEVLLRNFKFGPINQFIKDLNLTT